MKTQNFRDFYPNTIILGKNKYNVLIFMIFIKKCKNIKKVLAFYFECDIKYLVRG